MDDDSIGSFHQWRYLKMVNVDKIHSHLEMDDLEVSDVSVF